MVTQLSKEQYLSTMGNKMSNVTESAQALCDIPNGTEFLTADELVNATIYRGKSLKERWDDVRIICMGGIPLDEYMKWR